VLDLLVRRWPRITTTVDKERGQYIYGVTSSTFERLDL